MPRPRRAAPFLALALLLACPPEDESDCPGATLGDYRFDLALDEDGADLDLDGVPDDADGDGLPDLSGCVARDGVPPGTFEPPVPPAFDATLSAVEETSVALCTGRRFSDPRIGTREPRPGGEALLFDELASTGAAVAECGPRCPVAIREGLSLLLAPDGSIRGSLVESFDVPVNAPGEDTYDCGACGGTCRAVWEVSGAQLP
jgi:hypothetical protein